MRTAVSQGHSRSPANAWFDTVLGRWLENLLTTNEASSFDPAALAARSLLCNAITDVHTAFVPSCAVRAFVCQRDAPRGRMRIASRSLIARHVCVAVALALTVGACVAPPDAGDADAAPTDGSIDGATGCGTGPACGAGQLCSFQPACGATPVRYCGDNTCGDAVAIYYCGCDSVTFVSGCLHPDRPYAHAGTCEDASMD